MNRSGRSRLRLWRKNIRLEWRSKDALNAMLFFSCCGGDFRFSFDPLRKSRGILLAVGLEAFLFASVVALNQTGRENCESGARWLPRIFQRRDGVVCGLRRLGNFLLVSLLESSDGAAVCDFYNLRVLGRQWQLVPVRCSGHGL